MSEITCVSGIELVMDYLEGVLPADDRVAIERHVAGCARCVAFLESYQATPRLLRNATATTMPADLEASLLAFLRAQRGAPPR